jgi:hypothetical protein
MGLMASTVAPLGPLTSDRTSAATRRDLRFRALWHGASIGEHRVAFRMDGDRVVVDTHIDIAVGVLFFTVFRLKHDAQEIWQSGRLISVTSTTDRDGTHLQVSGNAVGNGFRIVGENGPFLAAADFLTTIALWDSRIVREQNLIDVQYGGEVGLVAKRLGDEQVATPQGEVLTSRYQMITPHYASSSAQKAWFCSAGESSRTSAKSFGVSPRAAMTRSMPGRPRACPTPWPMRSPGRCSTISTTSSDWHPAFESLPIAEMVPTTGRAPIHAGAERYYREQGWAAVIRRHLSVIGLLFPR